MKKAIVQVFTGHGKGKTTAAIGQAIRALGWKKKVLLIQFLKKGLYGEIKTLKHFNNVKIIQSGPNYIVEDWIKLKKKGVIGKTYDKVKDLILSGEYHLVILDEINFALDKGLIEMEEVIKLINNRPKDVNLILTGRNAPKKIIEMADLVTEMKEIKHDYRKGMKARKGIEY